MTGTTIIAVYTNQTRVKSQRIIGGHSWVIHVNSHEFHGIHGMFMGFMGCSWDSWDVHGIHGVFMGFIGHSYEFM